MTHEEPQNIKVKHIGIQFYSALEHNRAWWFDDSIFQLDSTITYLYSIDYEYNHGEDEQVYGLKIRDRAAQPFEDRGMLLASCDTPTICRSPSK